MSKKVMILLPEKIYIKKMKEYQGIVTMQEEYNIYFKNLIYPYSEMWDVQVRCKYGTNLGNCWRLSNFKEDVPEFDFEIVIYDEYGEKIASKKSTVVIVTRNENVRTKVLFFGDSMTHKHVYVDHIVNSLRGIETVGSRSFDGFVRHEGRGGWSYKTYFNNWFEKFGLSPFLFPKGIKAEDYYGDRVFIEKTLREDSEVYQYYGYSNSEIKNGQYYVADKKLYKKCEAEDELISEEPEFEFDFSKYLSRFGVEKPEILSVLLGANDLQICAYEKSEERIAEYIEYAEKFTAAVHRCDENIKIIINLPVTGAEQYAWGTRLGCDGSEKMYRHNIMKASERLLSVFGSREAENIYISPMIFAIDPDNGFPTNYVKVNKYSENMEQKQSNWVHPNESGYRQMGDCLAAVIEHIRGSKQ